MARAHSQLLIPLWAVSLLAGCATPDIPPTVAVAGMPNTELALRRSMDQVNADMGQLGGLQAYDTAPIPTHAQLPAELERHIQFVWVGPLDAGVRKLGDSLGYTVSVAAPKNSQPLLVVVNVTGQAFAALRALGEQAGDRATVAVDPQNRQITVTHHV